MLRQLTCTTLFCVEILLILLSELSPLDVDDSLDKSETVSLKAESLSGLPVRDDSLMSLDVAVLEIVELAPETIELERLWVCVRPCRMSPFCSNKLNSVKMESNSDSWVSSKFAIENLYEFILSLFDTDNCSLGRSLTGDCWYVSKPCKIKEELFLLFNPNLQQKLYIKLNLNEEEVACTKVLN